MNAVTLIEALLYPLEECIIVAGKFGGERILAKNRDRTYKPEIRIIHTVKDGVEIVYLEDVLTGWAEGMNEFGIGIVNTALRVGYDEKEKVIVNKTGTKSKEGKKIKAALSNKTLKKTLSALMDSNVLGHTFVSDLNTTFAIEATSAHKGVKRKLEGNKVVVRTNHGHEYDDAGYTKGPDYLSSKLRKADAEKLLKSAGNPDAVLGILRKQPYNGKSKQNLNMFRSTPNMSTTSQLLMNLDKLRFVLSLVSGKVVFKGISKELPKNYKPKIEIEIQR